MASAAGSTAGVISGYLDHLAVERGTARNTLDSYARDLRRYARTPGGAGCRVDLADVTSSARHVSSSPRCGKATRTIRRWPRRRPRGRVVAVRGPAQVRVTRGPRPPHDPAREVRPPAPPRRLPKALPVDDVLRLLDTPGAGRPAPAARPGAAGAALLHRRAHLRGGRPGRRRRRPRRAHGRCWTARAASSGWCRSAGPRSPRVDAYLVRARPALAPHGRAPPALFLNARGGRLSRQSAWQVLQGRGRSGGHHRRGLAAHAAPLLRHPPAGRRRRCPGRAGTARPRLGDHDPGVHAGHGDHPARGLRHGAPPRRL